MKKIETATGKKFPILWCGASSLDGQLRLCVTGLNLASAFSVFSDPSEIKEIKYYINDDGEGEYRTFAGFKTLRGVNEDNSGIVVALAKGD